MDTPRRITRSLSRQSLDCTARSEITYVTDTLSRKRKNRNKQQQDTVFNDTVSCFEFGDNAIRRNMRQMPAIPDASPEQQIFEPFDLPLRNNRKKEEPVELCQAPFPSARPQNQENNNADLSEKDSQDEPVDTQEEIEKNHLRKISEIITNMYRIGKYIIDSKWFSHAITVILLLLAVQYINNSEKKIIQSEPAHQSRMEKEINNLRHELESYAIKSKESYSMELKNCLKVASDIRTEMGAHVLSLEDKLRQTQSELSLYVGRLQQDVKELLNFKNDTAQSVKIRFDHWIKDEYKSDEFKAVVEEQIDRKTKKGSIFDSLGSFGSSAKLEDVEALISAKLRQYHEDKTGQMDFALSSNGGSILEHRCTASKHDHSRYWRILGLSVMHFHNQPTRAIEDDTSPGNCWAFDGARGHLTIKLGKPVMVTSITVEHIPTNLSPTGSISAPRAFTVSAMNNENDLVGHELGQWEYNINDHPIQTFNVMRKMHFPSGIIDFRFESNWGGSYTCIYRVRVHGDPFD
ncbi:Oidioi.mRNA.OKI2018_I69.chr2.g6618.t1.cds [Oikopleura dioica]|uniref:Oidioi.mRNA.OKI2018_I69.chr2.g6618.t1.cds n=1 Tax=Oikopleura dioica TaxID=34765 RepID=A0ABN7T3M2_OIKDI|nr:Oidioi.mRNA.OKI2018_I69.chr2.g6618.t1.cds [Oikopleura dioica]